MTEASPIEIIEVSDKVSELSADELIDAVREAAHRRRIMIEFLEAQLGMEPNGIRALADLAGKTEDDILLEISGKAHAALIEAHRLELLRRRWEASSLPPSEFEQEANV